MTLENIKTLGQLLQEIVEEQEYYYSLHEFLLESTEEERKEVEKKLTELDYNQYYEFLDSQNFKDRDELEATICEYCEYVNQQDLGMGEMGEISDMADDYIREKGLPFED